MSNILKIVVCTCAFIRFFVAGGSVEDLKQEYVDTIMACAKDFPVAAEHMQQLKTGKFPDDQNVKCLFACTYKKIGMMDDRGLLSVEGVEKISQKYFADDAERIENSKKYTQACTSVNDIPVSDGEKGCDRAALIFKCSVEKAPEFGFA